MERFNISGLRLVFPPEMEGTGFHYAGNKELTLSMRAILHAVQMIFPNLDIS